MRLFVFLPCRHADRPRTRHRRGPPRGRGRTVPGHRPSPPIARGGQGDRIALRLALEGEDAGERGVGRRPRGRRRRAVLVTKVEVETGFLLQMPCSEENDARDCGAAERKGNSDGQWNDRSYGFSPGTGGAESEECHRR